jgi:hypothetical protein
MLENLIGSDFIAGSTDPFIITLGTGLVFNPGDVVTMCAVLPNGNTLFSKTASYTAGQNTATISMVASDTNTVVFDNRNLVMIKFQVKIVNGSSVSFLHWNGKSFDGAFRLKPPIC